MPSNDTANDYTLTEQQDNFEAKIAMHLADSAQYTGLGDHHSAEEQPECHPDGQFTGDAPLDIILFWK